MSIRYKLPNLVRNIQEMPNLSVNWRDKFLGVEKEEIEEEIVEDNFLYLGTEEKDGGNLITIPFNPKRRITLIISGGNDSGKSILAKSIVYDQLYYKFKRYIFMIDPNKDSYSIINKNNNHNLRNKLANYGIEPNSYHCKWIIPQFVKMFGSRGEEYAITLKDFDCLDRTTKLITIGKFLGLKPDEPAWGYLSSLVYSKNPPKTIKELRIRLKELIKKMKTETGRAGIIPKLLRKIAEKINTQQIIDPPEDYSKKFKRMNIPEEIVKHKILIMETRIYEESLKTDIDSYMQLAITSLIEDKIKHAMSKGKYGYISRPVTFFGDEADNYANRQSQCMGIIKRISTKYRVVSRESKEVGFDSILVTQKPHDIDYSILNEADYWIYCGITNDKIKELVKSRGMTDKTIEIIKSHPIRKNEYPKPFVYQGRTADDWGIFYPLPTCSSM